MKERAKTTLSYTLPGFLKHLTQHCTPTMIWPWGPLCPRQIWHQVNGIHPWPMGQLSWGLCASVFVLTSCYRVRMQSDSGISTDFPQLTQDDEGRRRHSRANHLLERIRFNFRVTFLTRWSWSYWQCPLLGVFKFLKTSQLLFHSAVHVVTLMCPRATGLPRALRQL